MKKTIMLTAPLLVLAYYGTSQVTTAEVNCEIRDVPDCLSTPHITINNNSKKISPRNVCVGVGETVTVNVTPDGTTASIEGKDGGWPIGEGESFKLKAPDTVGEYGYNVHFEDGTCVDPRITITL